MAGFDINLLVRTARGLPAALADLITPQPTGVRGGKYGELLVHSLVPTKHPLADEGSYFVATNPVPGTGVALNAVVTAFSDTNAFLQFKNIDGAGGKRIYPDYIRLMLFGTPPTAVVSQQFAMKRSKATDRAPTATANRTVNAPVCTAGASGRSSIALLHTWAAGAAFTIPASSTSDEVVSRCSIPTGIGIAGEEYIIKFGGDPGDSVQGLTATKAVAPGKFVTHAPALIVEPGEWLTVHRWSLTEATNAPTFEYEIAWWER